MLGLSDENGPKSDELIPTLLRIAQKYNLKVITLSSYYSEKYNLFCFKNIFTNLVSVHASLERNRRSNLCSITSTALCHRRSVSFYIAKKYGGKVIIENMKDCKIKIKLP